MGLTRKKITVRSKKGKTYQRSVMVKAESIGKRGGGKKLNAMNPWESHHTEHVDDSSWYKGNVTHDRHNAKNRGSSGPGSDHSWFAHLVGQQKSVFAPTTTQALTERDVGSAEHAHRRRLAGEDGAYYAGRAGTQHYGEMHQSIADRMNTVWTAPHARFTVNADSLGARHGRENIHEVHQDPRKWVR